jgi:DNA-directed RNA polymerase delta subunit
MKEELRDIVLEAIEESLNAQLRVIRRLRKGEKVEALPSRRSRLSQVDMAYDILQKSRHPLHVNALIERIRAAFGVDVDRESLVSSLTKKVARGDRFVRTEPNTFGLRPEG